jgi:hypothetical protein
MHARHLSYCPRNSLPPVLRSGVLYRDLRWTRTRPDSGIAICPLSATGRSLGADLVGDPWTVAAGLPIEPSRCRCHLGSVGPDT